MILASRDSHPATTAPVNKRVAEIYNFLSGILDSKKYCMMIVATIAHLLLVSKRGMLTNFKA